MNFFDLDDTKTGCTVRACTNSRGKHHEGGTYRFCRRCRDRRYEQENPVRYAFSNLRKSAKRRGHGFSLTYEQFEKFVMQTDYMTLRGKEPEDMTIDRKDSKKGYEDGNLRLATNRDNGTKRDREDLPPAQIAPAEDDPFRT